MSLRGETRVAISAGYPTYCFMFGVSLILAAILANKWTIGFLFTSDGRIDELVAILFIWLFDLYLILLGTYILLRRKELSLRRVVGGHIKLVLMLLAVEIALHIGIWMVHIVSPPEPPFNRRLALSPYQGKSWADTLFDELNRYSFDYDPWLTWRGGEFHGKYLNVDNKGFRSTWNPERYDLDRPDSIFIFGGSTVWGVGVRDEGTLPSHVSRILNAEENRWHVTNCGEQAYIFAQEVIHLTLMLQEGRRPDYVLFYSGANDVFNAYDKGQAGRLHEYIGRESKLRLKPTDVQHLKVWVVATLNDNVLIYRVIKLLVDRIVGGREYRGAAALFSNDELARLADDVLYEEVRWLQVVDGLSQVYGFGYACCWQPQLLTEKWLTEEEKLASSFYPSYIDPQLGKLAGMVDGRVSELSIPHFFSLSNALHDRKGTCYIDVLHLSEEGNEIVARRLVQVLGSCMIPVEQSFRQGREATLLLRTK